MDNETRGIILKTLDDLVKDLHRKDSSAAITGWFTKDILMEDIALDWIAKDSTESSSELAVGYVIGYLASTAHHILLDRKWKAEVAKFMETKKSEQQELPRGIVKEEKKIILSVTKEEVTEIRDMIKPEIPQIRTEIYRAMGV